MLHYATLMWIWGKGLAFTGMPYAVGIRINATAVLDLLPHGVRESYFLSFNKLVK